MNVLDQKKEMCLSFDTPPSIYLYKERYEMIYCLIDWFSMYFDGDIPYLSVKLR